MRHSDEEVFYELDIPDSVYDEVKTLCKDCFSKSIFSSTLLFTLSRLLILLFKYVSRLLLRDLLCDKILEKTYKGN